MKQQEPVQKKPDSGSRAKQQTPSSGAFDIWLERTLHNMFETVAQEPIPDDFLNLIKGLDSKTRK